jgi:hypothetical protein
LNFGNQPFFWNFEPARPKSIAHAWTILNHEVNSQHRSKIDACLSINEHRFRSFENKVENPEFGKNCSIQGEKPKLSENKLTIQKRSIFSRANIHWLKLFRAAFNRFSLLNLKVWKSFIQLFDKFKLEKKELTVSR